MIYEYVKFKFPCLEIQNFTNKNSVNFFKLSYICKCMHSCSIASVVSDSL